MDQMRGWLEFFLKPEIYDALEFEHWNIWGVDAVLGCVLPSELLSSSWNVHFETFCCLKEENPQIKAQSGKVLGLLVIFTPEIRPCSIPWVDLVGSPISIIHRSISSIFTSRRPIGLNVPRIGASRRPRTDRPKFFVMNGALLAAKRTIRSMRTTWQLGQIRDLRKKCGNLISEDIHFLWSVDSSCYNPINPSVGLINFYKLAILFS